MKYFINNISEEQWKKNTNDYWERYKKVKRNISKELDNAFTSGYLHDSEIIKIEFDYIGYQKTHVYDMFIEVKNEEFHGVFIHKNVHSINFKYDNSGKYKSLYEYLYGEILIEKGKLIHNISLYPESEINIVCEKIEWKNIID